MSKADALGGGLTAIVEPRGNSTKVTLAGAITEFANFSSLMKLEGAVVIDLSGIERLNSLGVRAWYKFVHACETAGLDLTFERCSPAVVEQMVMISNFVGTRSRIASLLVPYFCESCEADPTQLIERAPGSPITAPPSITCPSCGKQAIIDQPENLYASLTELLAKR